MYYLIIKIFTYSEKPNNLPQKCIFVLFSSTRMYNLIQYKWTKDKIPQD